MDDTNKRISKLNPKKKKTIFDKLERKPLHIYPKMNTLRRHEL